MAALVAGGCIDASGLSNRADGGVASDLSGLSDAGDHDMPSDLAALIPDLATVDLADLPDAAVPPDLAPACRTDGDCRSWQVCSNGKCTDWTPAQLPGLALWLDADRDLQVQGGAVSAWLDQSGQRNTAVGVGRPTQAAAALAGHDAVHFDGSSSLTISDAASLRWQSGAFTVEVVGRYTNPPTTGVNDYRYAFFYGKVNPSVFPYQGAALLGNTNYKWLNCGFPVPSLTGVVAQVESCSAGGAVGSTVDNDAKWHVIGMHRAADGVTLSVRGDGALRSTHIVSAVDVSAAGFPAQIGGLSGSPEQLIGDIAEVVATAGSDDANDLARLEAYLAHKYGL
jgi:hypothetical protein